MQKINQIYDKIFKRIITLSGSAVVRFINTVFEKDFPLDAEITYNWTESVDDRLGKKIADTIITINGAYKFHAEVQAGDDSVIAVRMFEYEFREAIKYRESDGNKITLNLPEARIIYLSHTDKTPDAVELVFNFQGQGVFSYKVKAEKLLNYTLDALDKSGMVIMIPLYLLKLRKEIQRGYKTKSKELAAELKSLVESCILSIEANENHGNITHSDADVLFNLLSRLYEQLYGDYEVFKEEGVDSMLDEWLFTKSELRVFEIVRNLLKDGDSIEKIQSATGVSRETILQIKAELGAIPA